MKTINKGLKNTITQDTGEVARYRCAIGGKRKYLWQVKVDRAFAALEKKGIVARHDFSDCMTGGLNDIEHEIKTFTQQSISPIGYTFYHGQDTIDACDCGELYLTFGSIAGDKKSAVEIGKKVRAALIKEGLPVSWKETCYMRIGIWVKGSAPSGYENEDITDGFPGFSNDHAVDQYIEDTVVSQGFKREHRLDIPNQDLMAFKGEYPGPICVYCDTCEAAVFTLIHIDGHQFAKKQQITARIDKLNSAAIVSLFSINDDAIFMIAKIPLKDIKANLAQFIRHVKMDISAGYAAFRTAAKDA